MLDAADKYETVSSGVEADEIREKAEEVGEGDIMLSAW